MKTKKVFKQLNFFKYDFVEEFLSNQHKEGWKLVKISPFGVLHFVECEPEEMVYCLDKDVFSVLDDKNPYLQGFADHGWEFVQMHRSCNFFRKRKDLFNENEKWPVDRTKRLKELKKIRDTSNISAIFSFIILLPVIKDWFKEGDYVLGSMVGILFVLAILGMFSYNVMYKKIKDKYYQLD